MLGRNPMAEPLIPKLMVKEAKASIAILETTRVCPNPTRSENARYLA